MLKHCAAVAASALLLVTACHAELKGVYKLQDGQQVDLYYRDAQHMRADVGGDKQLVLKGAETWVLKRQDTQWLAINADNVGGLLRALSKSAGDPTADAGPVQLRALGRRETVAGYTGDVYELSSGDKKYDVVLSDHPDVRALTDGWRAAAQKIAQNLGQRDAQRLQQALEAIPASKGGLLRQGDNIVLVSIDNKARDVDVDFPPNTQVVQLPAGLSLPR